MLSKDPNQPILILRLQFNESEQRRIDIYSMGDATTQLQSFCTSCGIRDKTIVERLRNRVAACLMNRDENQENFSEENLSIKQDKKFRTDSKEGPGHRRLNSKQITIDTSHSNFGIHNSSYMSKTTKGAAKTYSMVQGHSHKLIRTLTESMKANLFGTKGPKRIELPDKWAQDGYINVESSDWRSPNAPPVTPSITKGVQQAFDQLGSPPSISKNSSSSFNEFRAYPRSTRSRSFVKSVTDEKVLEDPNSLASKNRNGKFVKKSSFYEYSHFTDHMQPSNIYNQFKCKGFDNVSTKSSDSLEGNVLKRLSMSELKEIFNKLDSDSLGHIGPRKMNLRALSANEFKTAEPIVAELLKRDSDAYFNFKDFCNIASEFLILD